MDLTGIECSYNDGDGHITELDADDVVGSPETFEEAGEEVEVTVTYSGVSATFNVAVTSQVAG